MRAEAANELHAYLASIVNSTEDAIISKGLDGAIRSWNRGAEKLFGYSASEMIGRSVATLVPRERSGEAFVLLERAKKGETITGLETERVRKGGQLFHVSVTVSPIRDAEGRIVGASKIARDITQWKRAEADLRRANQDLMQFSYAAAHDLQEPLRNISLLLGTLKDCRARHAGHPSASDADEEALIEEMTGNAHHMISMVRDLLAFTNVAEDGGQERAPVDANDILRQVLRSLAGAISESGVRISHGPLPMVKIAPTHLAQLLQNLIANAIKYRKRNEACVIEISATRRGAQWVFAVADNGIGFDPVYAERIFGIFKRLHQKKEYPGTGIGLALCSRIVANYGGRIWAEGRSGVGATFRFTVSAQDRVALPRRKNADCRGS
jgi:PAS domain S-box-containing protein